MLTEDAFMHLLKKAKNWERTPENVKFPLERTAYRQVSKSHWPNGRPIEIFYRDNFYCIRWQNGTWFHYDLLRGAWF